MKESDCDEEGEDMVLSVTSDESFLLFCLLESINKYVRIENPSNVCLGTI